MPRAEQRGGAAIQVLIASSVFLGLSLGSRAFWAIELVEKTGLRPPRFFLSATAGVCCAMDL